MACSAFWKNALRPGYAGNGLYEGYQATGKEDFEKTCRETFTYVLRDMTSPEGGFFSGEDAGQRRWRREILSLDWNELHQILPDEEYKLVKKLFNQSKRNFQEGNGQNIFYLSKPFNEFPGFPANIEKIIESSRRKLFEAREKRIHPGKDDKILTDWNGINDSSPG